MNSAYFDEHLPKLPLKSVFQYWEVHRFKRADAVTVVSSYLRGYLEERGIPAEKILVNQNGVNPEIANITAAGDVREQYDIPRDVFVIGYIGGMEPFRRLPEVVRYIADLRRAGNRDVYLLLVGDGAEMPAVRTALEAERDVLQNSVILTGWVPHSEVPRYLATCSLAIFPFTNDYCSPLKLFEYLGAGIPTIGPDTPAVREVFQDGVHLKLVKQDGSDFVTSILEMRADPQLRARLSSQGQRLVLEEYTWERNAERVIQHIQKFVEPMTQTADTQ
jgi:glycosyltransferase involved in cell wall biosynthesis